MTGVFTETGGPADGQLASINLPESSDAALAALFDSSSGAPGAEFDPADLGLGEDFEKSLAQDTKDDHQAASPAPVKEPVAEMPPAEPPVAPQSFVKKSRAERFGTMTPEPQPAPAAEASRESAEARADRPWRRYIEPGETPEVVSAKRGMSAAKVLTPLVAAVSFAPGSSGTPAAKASALTEMLVGVHRCARETAETISVQTGQDVPHWLVTQLMQNLAVAIATRWQRGEGADVDALASNMRQIFQGDSQELVELIKGASDDAYQPVNHPDIARYRISVSAANAAWVIYDWVTHEKLSLDSKGEKPSLFFTYGLPVNELVNRMLVTVVNECRALVAQVESADMRTAHMQNAIARMANLVGSEYVTRTRQIMNWIAEPSISEDEYRRRYDVATHDLDARILPEIYLGARTNFLRIEQGAFKAIEDLYEKANSASHAGRGDHRPASH